MTWLFVVENGDAFGRPLSNRRFRSAQLEGVASELVIDSGHSVHTDPRAIHEVRRILLEHAAETDDD